MPTIKSNFDRIETELNQIMELHRAGKTNEALSHAVTKCRDLYNENHAIRTAKPGQEANYALSRQVFDLKEVNKYLAQGIADASRLTTAHLIRIRGLEDENARLRAALQDLMDEQNGPPLERHRLRWEKAYFVAANLLNSKPT